MKRKMLTKLISAVCALALTTSCTAMSVGAVPETIAKEAWIDGYNTAMDLTDRVEEVGDNGYLLEECSVLADKIEEFLNGVIYNVLYSKIPDERKIAFSEGFYDILDGLRSNDLEQRKLSTNRARDLLFDVADSIEYYINFEM